MTYVKRIFGYPALAVIVALACLELVHWDDTRIDLVSENTAMILRLTPAAAITEEERTMMETLSGCPVIQEMMENGEGDVVVSENREVMDIAETCLGPENASLSIVSVLSSEERSALILSWRMDKKGAVLQKAGKVYFKTYSRDGLLGTRSVYENWDNGRVRQSVSHHWWFSWLLANR